MDLKFLRRWKIIDVYVKHMPWPMISFQVSLQFVLNLIYKEFVATLLIIGELVITAPGYFNVAHYHRAKIKKPVIYDRVGCCIKKESILLRL